MKTELLLLAFIVILLLGGCRGLTATGERVTGIPASPEVKAAAASVDEALSSYWGAIIAALTGYGAGRYRKKRVTVEDNSAGTAVDVGGLLASAKRLAGRAPARPQKKKAPTARRARKG